MLFYVPLECYKERYTMQWSAPKTGWLEAAWGKAGIPYQRIDSSDTPYKPQDLKLGVVLDPILRTEHCFAQIKELLYHAREGSLDSKDVIFFDDFWHPGIEALPYTFDQMKKYPKIFAYCHAQSVDEFDFTYPMRHWMRHFEKGIGEILTGIFVGAPILKDLLHQGGVAPRNKIHVVGHPFDSKEVLSRMPEWYKRQVNGVYYQPRKNQVVFSSRWDKEKNPAFFLEVAKEVLRGLPHTTFVICTSAPKIRSNSSHLLKLLDKARAEHPNIILKENLTKEQYYEILCESKIQFNCSNQDFVSFVLLEGSVAGCWPMYPYFRSFPDVLWHDQRFFYEHLDLKHAVHRVEQVLCKDSEEAWSTNAIEQREWIHTRYNDSWMRMANIMGLYNKWPMQNLYKGVYNDQP